MRSNKAARGAEIDPMTAQVDSSLEREFPAKIKAALAPGRRSRLDGLGSALIEIYEAGAEHPIKIDLLDQFVSIIRRKGGSDERAREIAKLMRGWQQIRRG